jgi:hypothetical protein
LAFLEFFRYDFLLFAIGASTKFAYALVTFVGAFLGSSSLCCHLAVSVLDYFFCDEE